MIGLGVGIDYALFIVTRYRQGLFEAGTPRQAVVTALATSGRAVLFAGSTVVISLLGLFLLSLPFLQGLAVGNHCRRAAGHGRRRSRCSRPCSASPDGPSTDCTSRCSCNPERPGDG